MIWLFLFPSRNMFVDIYVNDILVSEDDREQSVIFGTSPGSRWHMVALDSSNPSITIRLEGTPCYTNVNGLIDNIYAGSTRDVYRIITSERFARIYFIRILQFIALVLICLYAYVHKKFHIEKDLLYLERLLSFPPSGQVQNPLYGSYSSDILKYSICWAICH